MARTTVGAVKEILGLASEGGDYNDRDNPSLTGYIDSATLTVDRVNTCATGKGITLTSAELENIEKWLAAFLYKLSDQQLSAKATSRASGSFRGTTGLNLDINNYGVGAKMADPSGCLVSVINAFRVGGFWLGKPPSTQLDYDERD